LDSSAYFNLFWLGVAAIKHFKQLHTYHHEHDKQNTFDLPRCERHEPRAWAKASQAPTSTEQDGTNHQGLIDLVAFRQMQGAA
jgi:hypothetical protein